jgi:hypothetical protein
MKTTLAWAVVATLVGVAGGVALGYWEARPWAVGLKPGAVADHSAEASNAASEANVAKAVVPETTYHFGNMESGTSQRHEFPIRNEGKSPLTVAFASHTCKCTTIELDGKPVEHEGDPIAANASITIPPGGEKMAMLEWAAKVPAGPFRHGATFNLIGDPAMSRLELNVEGEIVESTTLEPAQLFFGSVNVAQPAKAELVVMAFLEPEVQIVSHEVVPAKLAEQMKVTIDPLTKDKLPDPEAQAGAKVIAEYDPGKTLGSFAGSLKLQTNLKRAPRLEVPIYGTVRGDISIIGKGWTEANGILRLEPVRSAQGGGLALNVAIRGEHAGDTELRVEKVEPSVLKATLGERKEMRENLVWVPLKVEIPAGARPMVRAGEDQGGEGEIVLGTTHPTTSEVRLRVQFTVQP